MVQICYLNSYSSRLFLVPRAPCAVQRSQLTSARRLMSHYVHGQGEGGTEKSTLTVKRQVGFGHRTFCCSCHTKLSPCRSNPRHVNPDIRCDPSVSHYVLSILLYCRVLIGASLSGVCVHAKKDGKSADFHLSCRVATCIWCVSRGDTPIYTRCSQSCDRDRAYQRILTPYTKERLQSLCILPYTIGGQAVNG